MHSLKPKLRFFRRIEAGENLHVLALGSSNTEHFMVGAHWFDYVNIGLMHTYRRLGSKPEHLANPNFCLSDPFAADNPHQCLNAGISNSTTADLLARFERDVVPFRPDLVILTAGINDANPKREISPEMCRRNLIELRRRINAWGGEVIFQTAYSCDVDELRPISPGWVENYPVYAGVVREVAGELLHDVYTRWERLRNYDLKAYRLLMRDSLHLNPLGNAVIGLDLARLLELRIPDENLPWIGAAVFARDCMDLLEAAEEGAR